MLHGGKVTSQVSSPSRRDRVDSEKLGTTTPQNSPRISAIGADWYPRGGCRQNLLASRGVLLLRENSSKVLPVLFAELTRANCLKTTATTFPPLTIPYLRSLSGPTCGLSLLSVSLSSSVSIPRVQAECLSKFDMFNSMSCPRGGKTRQFQSRIPSIQCISAQ